jgi:CO/xanthine dehydrogenase FAD-binding subunit
MLQGGKIMANMALVRPDSLKTAVEFLDQQGSETKILAGGTDVMAAIRAGEVNSKFLMDINKLDELKGIELTKEGIVVGAGVTLSEINKSDLLKRYAPALQKASINFASHQIRNLATIGGNVGNCSPCGDTIPPLVIHESQVVLASSKGQRCIPIEETAAGPYQCSRRPDEIIVKFVLKPSQVAFSDFQKIGRRKELAVARMSMAVMMGKDATEKVSQMFLSLGACTPTPQRITAVEDFFIGKIPTMKVVWDGGKLLAEKMIEVTGKRPSIIYKEPAVQGLFLRMLYPMVSHEK